VFVNFFLELRNNKVPATLREYLTLLEAMKQHVTDYRVEEFYYLARAALVKDEKNIDKFDQVFAKCFNGLDFMSEEETHDIPEEWLQKLAEKVLSPEEMAEIEAMGGFEKLMEELKKRLEEQKKRHQGGNKWIGTAGTSPFGAHGYNPEGVRIGQKESRHRRAVKVWDKREFKNLDDELELGTRNIKVALRRLRRFAREGGDLELDLPDTIKSTADNAGYLDIKMVPERRNQAKVLLLLDIGGSMDDHIRTCEELFSAAKTEFKHMEHYYFHNCLYEKMWKDNRRRHSEYVDSWQVLHTFPSDYKLIFVGDATMSPYEIVYPGGSVEHWNEESGETWMKRFLNIYQKSIWLNPVPQKYWDYTPSIKLIQEMMGNRMHPLTLEGLEAGMKELSK